MESRITVSAIAGKGQMNRSFNLDVLADHLPLTSNDTPGIIGIKYGQDVRRGILKKIKKKKIQQNTRRTRGFINQCTLLVRIQNRHIINIKLFNTGEIVLTGAKSPDNNQEAVTLLYHALKNSIEGSSYYRYYQHVSERFKRDADFTTFVHQYQTVLDKLFRVYENEVSPAPERVSKSLCDAPAPERVSSSYRLGDLSSENEKLYMKFYTI